MEPLTPADPARIASYELLARLGAGGMGLVYLARSPGGRLVAVKVIHTNLTDDPRFLQRFRSEVRAARAVSGFYTAPVIDADTDSRPAWLATAHVPGPDLATVVKTRGPLPGTYVTALAAALAEALKAVHASGVVHRDLKPSNILLAQDGPRVIDFGIVHALDGPATLGGLVGTPGYMSPEQAGGGEIEPANDVFALGGVLYFASTGRPPFGVDTLPVILRRVVHEEPDLAQVPPAQRDLVARCMAKRPSERPSPDELLDALADSIAAAGHVDWAGLYGTVIDAYVTETATYTSVDPEPELDPEPDAEPEPEPDLEPEPEPEARRTTQPEPDETVQPGSVLEPDHRPPAPSPARLSRSRSRRWALLPVIALVAAVVFALNSRDAGQGTGFRPWSVDDVRGRAFVSDGLVYVGKADGTAAYDARTGRQRWESRTGAEEVAGGVHGGVLFVRSAGQLGALDARSGRRRWRVPLSEAGCLTQAPDPAGRVLVAEEIDRGDAPGRLRFSAFGPAAGKPLWSKTLGLSGCGNDLTVGGGRISVVERGENGPKEQFLVSIAIGSGKSWRVPTESVRAMAADGTNVYTVVRGDDDRYRVRAHEAGTGRSRWDVRFPESDLELGGSGLEMSAAGSRLYVLGDDGFHALDIKDGRRRWTSAVESGDSGEFLLVGSAAYVWWDDTDRSLFRTKVRTAMSAIDLTNGRRRWGKRTDSRADIAFADDRTAYIASFRQHRFRWDDNALIALDTRTGRERWRRDMDVDDAVVSSGIVYVRDGRTLEAIDGATGEGP